MKLLHNILRGSTLATALFIFQSCYGMPQNLQESMMYEAKVKVTDAKGKALQGVKVYVKNADMADFNEVTASDAEGLLSIEVAVPAYDPSLGIRFEAEGYAVKDTVITDATTPEPDFAVQLVKN